MCVSLAQIDLPAVDLDKVMDQMHNAFGFEKGAISKVCPSMCVMCMCECVCVSEFFESVYCII